MSNETRNRNLAMPNLSRRGFISAAGTAGLSLTALGMVGREARAATLNPDLTMAPSENPASAYPDWFPTWDRIEEMAREEGQVNVTAWGGPEVKDHFEAIARDFQQEYGIRTEYRHGDWFSAQQQVLTDVERGVERGGIDAIFLWGQPFSNLMQGNGIWEVPILDLLPNARKIAYRPEMGRFVHDMVPTYGTFVPHLNYQNCFVYDKAKYAREDMPDSVDGVLEWAREHPREFTYCDFNRGGSGHTWGMMLIYELTGGYSKYAFRPFDPEVAERDWDPLWEYLSELGEHIYEPGTYPQGNAAVASLFSAGEISFCPNWDAVMGGQVTQGFLDPERLGVYVPTPGIYSPFDGFTIPVNASNKAAALLWLNYITSVEAQKSVVEVVGGYPAVTDAWEQSPEEIRTRPWHPVQDLRNWRDLGNVGSRHGEYMFKMMSTWVDKIARA